MVAGQGARLAMCNAGGAKGGSVEASKAGPRRVLHGVGWKKLLFVFSLDTIQLIRYLIKP
jgi:hypothetical protein